MPRLMFQPLDRSVPTSSADGAAEASTGVAADGLQPPLLGSGMAGAAGPGERAPIRFLPGEDQAALDHRFNGGGWTEGPVSVPAHLSHLAGSKRPLKGLPAKARIMVLGHGGRDAPLPAGAHYATDRLAGLSAQQLADRLVAQGLDKHFSGTLYLESCSSGSGFSDGSSFAQALQTELSHRGYRRLSLAGLPGATYLDRAGDNFSEVDALTSDLPLALQQSRGIAERLRAQRTAHAAALAAAQAGDGGAGKVQDDTTRALTRALRSEQSHLAGLKVLKRVIKMEDKRQLTPREAEGQRLAATGVRNWWGRLGPSAPPKRRT